jgi:hypothetical protein
LGGTIERQTQIYVAAVVVDHPQLDKFTVAQAVQASKVQIMFSIELY